MNLNDLTDTLPDYYNKTIYKLRIKFEDETIISPTDIFEQVQKLVSANIKEIRPKVGRLGELFVGHGGAGASVFFTLGFYFRKAIEAQEKIHGKSVIQYDEEELTIEQIKQFIAKFAKLNSEKWAELSVSIMKDGLPEEFQDND